MSRNSNGVSGTVSALQWWVRRTGRILINRPALICPLLLLFRRINPSFVCRTEFASSKCSQISVAVTAIAILGWATLIRWQVHQSRSIPLLLLPSAVTGQISLFAVLNELSLLPSSCSCSSSTHAVSPIMTLWRFHYGSQDTAFSILLARNATYRTPEKRWTTTLLRLNP